MVGYRKTKDGRWAVCGPVSEVRIGGVTVTKRDGTTKSERVVGLGKPFDTDKGRMVYGYLEDRAPKGTSGQACAECGAPAVTTAYDSSGIEGPVCARCKRMSRWERSFA